MATSMYVTNTLLQCSSTSVGLAQACPNKSEMFFLGASEQLAGVLCSDLYRVPVFYSQDGNDDGQQG